MFAPITDLFRFLRWACTGSAEEWHQAWLCRHKFRVSLYEAWWVLYGSRR